MGEVVRGTIRSFSFYSERSSRYDGIFRKLLKFDSQGGSIDEDAYVEELCKLHGMKDRPKIVHKSEVGPKDEFGRVTYGKYDPINKTITIYDGSNKDLCEYANTMAHEIQHASDDEKGLLIGEPIAHSEGEEAEYACEKKVSAAFKEQQNRDANFSSDFGVYNCNNSYGVSCVDVDSNDLERLKRNLQSSAIRLEEIRTDIEQRFSEVAIDWQDNKYDELSMYYKNVCNPKLQGMIQEMNAFVNHLNKKIGALLRYQNSRIPFE